MALSDTKLRTLKATGATYKVYDAGGLYLEVTPSGARLWRYRYRAGSKDKRLALGAYPETSLAAARKKRGEARRLQSEGLDPVMERKREKLTAAFKAANSFGDIAKEYIEKMVADGRAETTTVKANWLLEQLKPIAAMPVADIKPIEVLAALKKLEARGKRETARRCRSFASRVFRYAQGEVGAHRYGEEPASRPADRVAAPESPYATRLGRHERENAVAGPPA